MKCPICSSELAKVWRNGKDAALATVQVHWKCGVCGGKFTRADLRPVSDTVEARD
jgi:transposase-like protein